MTQRIVRRPVNAAPRFSLQLSPRPLMPMAVVAKDAAGNTSYSLQQPAQDAGRNPQSIQQPRGGATLVVQNVYLGSYGDARSKSQLRALGIRRILNVAEECSDSDSDDGSDSGDSSDADGAPLEPIVRKHIQIKDHSDEDIASFFGECLEFIRQGVVAAEPVLVHCRFGVSRSATIVIAYLMRYGTAGDLSASPASLPYEASFDWVKARRPQVSPNLGFVLALHSFEQETLHTCPEVCSVESREASAQACC